MRKSYHRSSYLLAALAFISLGGEARAWGDLGHKVICEIAFRLVLPDTRAAIDRLMQLDSEFKAFSGSCIYPDHPRIRAAEHFLNLSRDSKGLTSDGCPQADACVLTAILHDVRVLASRAETDASRLIALKSVGHWVAIHQPLHVSFLDDRGGNTIRTSGQCPGNLHAVWDTCLVQYAVGPDASEAATDLLAVITPEMKVEWSASMPRDWPTNPLRSLRPPARGIASTAERPATRRRETWRLERNTSMPTNLSSRSSFRRLASVWLGFSIWPC